MISIISLGNGGANIADAIIRQYPWLERRAMAIDTDASDLDNHIGDKLMVDRAERLNQFATTTEQKKIQDAVGSLISGKHPYAVVCVALGGKTSTAYLEAVLHAAGINSCATIVLCTTPYPFEGAKRAQVAQNMLEYIKHHADIYYVQNNALLAETDTEIAECDAPLICAFARVLATYGPFGPEEEKQGLDLVKVREELAEYGRKGILTFARVNSDELKDYACNPDFREEIDEVLAKVESMLGDDGHRLTLGIQVPYNPMEEFLPYVSPKEIVHSKIIAGLLDPNGRHGLGNLFLKSFLERFRCGVVLTDDDVVSVSTEKKVDRQMTEGGQRSIDIFVGIENNGCKKAGVIIENKLNGAAYQPMQLEDYQAAIEKAGYKKEDIYTLCLHCNPISAEHATDINADVLFPEELADWIDETLDAVPDDGHEGIIAYSYYLRNLNKDVMKLENARHLLDMDDNTLAKVADLAEAYNAINEAKEQIIKERIKKMFATHKLSEDDFVIETDEYDYNPALRIKVWRQDEVGDNVLVEKVLINYPESPLDDRYGTDIYRCADMNQTSFNFRNTEEREKMFEKIEELLGFQK